MTAIDILNVERGTEVFFADELKDKKTGEPKSYLYDGPSCYQYKLDSLDDTPRVYNFVNSANGRGRSIFADELHLVHLSYDEAIDHHIELVMEYARNLKANLPL